ncbi:MAG TPA: glycine cleavage system protein GcvH [Clostridia bacterium]|jgi:glycine cleavage system H protein|nr:MAG: Glycine cleavage system H protein [Firmicutes bacterium ADurb.Bin099]HNZ41292.1 glycine cleavage system protein GcvH [Clostridia bacterium]HPY98436.1 glycine cleavage system protein GcvH [Clostridia bacterium]HQC68314.1 glycine cleavage system protein GcvH [Clostridia bacterium]
MRFTRDHEWIKKEGKYAYIGITDYAQQQLGDIVYVELAEEDLVLQQGDVLCAIESVKTAAEVYMPVSGTVIEANAELEDAPEKINEDPYGTYLAKIIIDDESELNDLMTEDEYNEFLESEAE